MKEEEVEKILKKQIIEIKPPEEILDKIEYVYKKFSKNLREKIKKKKINAEVFLGGSLAKSTIVKKDYYDIDIFVRFDKKYGDKKISNLLGKILGSNAKKIHGSRDYYQTKEEKVLIEIIPVLKIKKPEDAENVTDLSYFHVNYLISKIKKNKNLIDEILLAKNFTYAQNVYGAESYINGFSGYALELLITRYKNFLNFIKEISKINIKKKLIIDINKFYKNEDQILTELNKAKKQSPIILIDPTFKERNALSGLSKETLFKFQKSCKSFLKNPSKNFFIKKEVSEDFKRYKNAIILIVETKKQAGDIAGTKSKKFFNFIEYKIKKEFEIRKSGFDYSEEENKSYFYFVLDKKKNEVIKGPPITSVYNLAKFKKVHPNASIKNGSSYSKVTHNLTFSKWFEKFLKEDKKIISDMGIKKISIFNSQ